jgi:hypothetical protein
VRFVERMIDESLILRHTIRCAPFSVQTVAMDACVHTPVPQC